MKYYDNANLNWDPEELRSPVKDLEHINSWAKRGNCREHPRPDDFFPTNAKGSAWGRRFCKDCPVKELCKTFALAHSPSGTWGGTSEGERDKYPSFVKSIVRQIYVDANQLENWNLPLPGLRLVYSALVEEQPSEQSDPNAA